MQLTLLPRVCNWKSAKC